jgi:hypothetical protein
MNPLLLEHSRNAVLNGNPHLAHDSDISSPSQAQEPII